MPRKHNPSGPIASRLIGLFASLFFSIPTAAFLWFWVNKELAYWGGFLNSSYLLACIAVFAAIALLLPSLFPSIIGGVWRWIIGIHRWWY